MNEADIYFINVKKPKEDKCLPNSLKTSHIDHTEYPNRVPKNYK